MSEYVCGVRLKSLKDGSVEVGCTIPPGAGQMSPAAQTTQNGENCDHIGRIIGTIENSEHFDMFAQTKRLAVGLATSLLIW